MARRVILVTGPPCAGKTTYAEAHAVHGDRILDQDQLGARAMRDAIAKLPWTDSTVWVIRCAPGPRARQALAVQLGATDHVHLEPSRRELVARARCRPSPRGQIAAIDKWFAAERADVLVAPRPMAPTVRPRYARTAGRKGRAYREAKAKLHARTQMCWLCGHAGAYELDHEPARVRLLELGLDPNDEQYHRAAHGSSCPCPTCGQSCNQIKGDGNRRPRMIAEW